VGVGESNDGEELSLDGEDDESLDEEDDESLDAGESEPG
jgi:hypothetical protein